MAQHKSAEKRNRQTIKRTAVNRIRTGRIRSSVKAVETAILTGDRTKAQAALKAAQPVIMSGVSKGVLKLATASRKMSRLSARVKAIASTA
jgi:small subunit ribosomal protein S20